MMVVSIAKRTSAMESVRGAGCEVGRAISSVLDGE